MYDQETCQKWAARVSVEGGGGGELEQGGEFTDCWTTWSIFIEKTPTQLQSH